jgi:hypothetical protein
MSPTDRPSVPDMLNQLEQAYQHLLAQLPASNADTQRLHITEQAIAAMQQPADQPLRYFIDHGKEHVGQAAEIIALIAYDQGVLL